MSDEQKRAALVLISAYDALTNQEWSCSWQHTLQFGAIQAIRPLTSKVEELFFELFAAIQPSQLPIAKHSSTFTRASHCLSLAAALLEVAKEKFHEGHWRDVPIEWRLVYSYASLISVSLHCTFFDFPKALEQCDHALLLGAPLPEDTITKLASALQSTIASRPDEEEGLTAGQKRSREEEDARQPMRRRTTQLHQINSDHLRNSRARSNLHTALEHEIDACIEGSSCKSIEFRHVPSLATFQTDFMRTSRPVLITGGMADWPALARWSHVAYLKEKAGNRTVPIEFGGVYTASSWGQRLMTLSDFIDEHVFPESAASSQPQGVPSFGYLAQHQLFDQIPELERDILTPDYCCLGDGEVMQVNAWFGPQDTVSPLHHDPHHNLLCQVVGYKYVRLFEPAESSRLYPHSDFLLSNTSQVDVGRPDFDKFPQLRHANYSEVVLAPGDMLYMPPKHWHYVRSLTVSFSVSHWWS
eukprot:m.94805 g.94805  ORF g.94805 m.94805 type:complete len:471 (-) comp51267_c0_seq9:25-1437(-)